MTTANNALLFNAAIEGFLAGCLRDRWLTELNSGTPPAIGTPDVSYEALVDQANFFAIECDSKVPNDHVGAAQPTGSQPISVITTGVAIAPTTSILQFGQFSKVRLFAAIALGITEGRYYGQPSLIEAADLSSVTTKSFAAYLQIAGEISGTGITDTNNEAIFFGCLAGAIAGMLSATPGAWATDEFDTIIAFADSLADVVDTGIPNDAAISAGNGQFLPASGAAPAQQAEFAKMRLIYSITLAVSQERNPLSVTTVIGGSTEAAWAATIGPAIIAAYKAISPSLISVPLDATPPLNPILWNEAFNGFVAGKFAGRPLMSTSTTDPNYLAVAAAAVQFANAVDAAVGASDITGAEVPTSTQAITSVGEVVEPIAPSTGTIQEGEHGKGGIMWAICRGTQHDRALLGTVQDTNESTYTKTAKSIVALYLDATLALLTP